MLSSESGPGIYCREWLAEWGGDLCTALSRWKSVGCCCYVRETKHSKHLLFSGGISFVVPNPPSTRMQHSWGSECCMLLLTQPLQRCCNKALVSFSAVLISALQTETYPSWFCIQEDINYVYATCGFFKSSNASALAVSKDCTRHILSC